MLLSLINLWGFIPQRGREITVERETLEKKIVEARKELVRLSPLRKEAEEELHKVSKQIDYWVSMKYEAEKKLVKVQKIPAYTVPTKKTTKMKKNPTVVEILSSLGNISSFDKERLITALTP